jgi:hypothetical protein
MQNSETRIRFGINYTHNLGNYETVRVEVNVDDYVRDGETADGAYERIKSFVQDKLEEAVIEIAKDLKK